MELYELLKIQRKKAGLTQEQLANQLFITRQSVSKWETGLTYPDIENLFVLSDLYDISLDELLRGSVYFKKPFLVGKKVKFHQLIIKTLIILLFCLIFPLFSIWFFVLFIPALISILPATFGDYWMITKKGLFIRTYSGNPFVKLKELIQDVWSKNADEIRELIPYQDIAKITLYYQKKDRLSPLDIWPDELKLIVLLKDEQIIFLAVSRELQQALPQAISYFEKKGILFEDKNQLVPLLVAGKEIYSYMHQEDNHE
ncbi:helix-turn-helix domain-containing protein [Isobaculum melis]|uniref:Helix-turn-helix domain-containing protein n=1 Tax=Isobaculum melis TaxID=142588 RepID=A0A1H9UD24_9LACT|nr:helix-turn-helix transcriptional regulator [Isobaculum melis]SES07242.1 Helix-turn-helix domain-containing protein [Isobaculum melis]